MNKLNDKITFRLPSILKSELINLAREKRMNLSEYLCYVLEQYVENKDTNKVLDKENIIKSIKML